MASLQDLRNKSASSTTHFQSYGGEKSSTEQYHMKSKHSQVDHPKPQHRRLGSDTNLDVGSAECSIFDAIRLFHLSNPESTIEFFLGFCAPYLHLASALYEAVEEYRQVAKSRPSLNAKLLSKSAHEWVHYACKVEQCGFDSLYDTEQALTNGMVKSAARTQTRRTHSLLKVISASAPTTISDKVPTSDDLCHWHFVLTEGANTKAGKFRTTGLAQRLHHALAPSAIQYLLQIVRRLAEQLDTIPVTTPQQAHQKFLLTFALAAFLQLHFYDIQPFATGNGRICVALGKHILNSILPVPFPMFTSLDKFSKAMRSSSPQKLLQLALREELASYEEILDHFQREMDDVIFASSEEELRRISLSAGIGSKDTKRLAQAFQQLGILESADVSIKTDDAEDLWLRVVRMTVLPTSISSTKS